jgi:hypothetical protein
MRRGVYGRNAASSWAVRTGQEQDDLLSQKLAAQEKEVMEEALRESQ